MAYFVITFTALSMIAICLLAFTIIMLLRGLKEVWLMSKLYTFRLCVVMPIGVLTGFALVNRSAAIPCGNPLAYILWMIGVFVGLAGIALALPFGLGDSHD